MSEGRSFHGTHLSIRIRKDLKVADHKNKHLFAVIASKKVAKTAVMRNRIRRRIYSAIRKTDFFKKAHSQSHQTHCAVFAKATAISAPLPVIVAELDSLLDKSGALK
jgi:RNase P protein component